MIVPANRPNSELKFRFVVFLLAVNSVLLGLILYVYFNPNSVVESFAYFIVNVLFFALCIWLLRRIDEANQRRRARHYRNRRRSPWGERRSEEPSAYNDRLATFVLGSCEPVQEGVSKPTDELAARADELTVGDPTFRSRMSFWSAVDVPCEPEPPKPVWFIRRMLQRIRDALVDYR